MEFTRLGAGAFDPTVAVVREYVIEVDERPVSIRMHYDWGCWCYLIYRVEALDAPPSSTADDVEGWGGADEDGRRSRGGSL